jgi:hypothetical protein
MALPCVLYCTIATAAAAIIMIRLSAANQPALPKKSPCAHYTALPNRDRDRDMKTDTLANASQMAMPITGSCTSHPICPGPCTSAWQTR